MSNEPFIRIAAVAKPSRSMSDNNGRSGFACSYATTRLLRLVFQTQPRSNKSP